MPTRKTKLFAAEAPDTSPLAVIDLGAHSARLRIVQSSVNDEMEVLEEATQNIPLGHDVFRSSYIGSRNMVLGEEIFRDFARLMREYGIKRYKAIATSAVREAFNRDIFLDRIKQASDIRLDILEGANEARVLFLAVREIMAGKFGFNTGDSIIYTIGTGSCQVSLVEDGRLVNAETIRVGTLRLAEEMEQQLTPLRMREAVDPLLAATFMGINRMSRRMHPENLIVVGAPVRALVAIVRSQTPAKVATMSKKTFDKHFIRLNQMDEFELIRQYGLSDTDAAGILPCCHMLEQLFNASEAERMIIPMVDTRDALTKDLFRELGGEPDSFVSQIIASAEHLGTRYDYDSQHAHKVTSLALRLYDQLSVLHGLPERCRVLLEVAGLLHDIGMFVSNREHHKHSYYLLRHSELPGLSSDELNLISLIARYHRRALPRNAHSEYVSLSTENRVLVSKLAAILRVADAFDRAHQNKVKDLRATYDNEKVCLTAVSDYDLSLAVAGVRNKGDMFEIVFARSIEIRVTGA